MGERIRYIPRPMRIRVDAERADPRKLAPAIESLRKGEVIVYPTDTGYAFGCALSSKRGINALRRLKGIDEKVNGTIKLVFATSFSAGNTQST